MGILNRIVLLSVRNHWICILLWVLCQFIFGTMLANDGAFVLAGTELFSAGQKLSADDIFYYHSWSGTLLLGLLFALETHSVGFAAWGIFLKLFIVIAGVPRAKVCSFFFCQ
jgi:hypothetical protein